MDLKSDVEIIHDINNTRSLLTGMKQNILDNNNIDLKLLLNVLTNADVKLRNIAMHMKMREEDGTDNG